jgi:hypothetical protein
VVPVHLAARVTEVGTLQLDAVAQDGTQRWKVEFDVRAGDGSALKGEVLPEQPILGVDSEDTEPAREHARGDA